MKILVLSTQVIETCQADEDERDEEERLLERA
jgi:hypothetical protein